MNNQAFKKLKKELYSAKEKIDHLTRLNDELSQSNAKEVKSDSHYFESEVNDLKTIIEYRDEKYSKLNAEFKKLLKNLNSIQNQD